MNRKLVIKVKPLLLYLLVIQISLFNIGCKGKTESGNNFETTISKDSLTTVDGKSLEMKQPLNNTNDIRTVYTNIVNKQREGTLDSMSFKYSCNGEKGGTVSYFSEQGKLRLIEHKYSEYDHYTAIDQFFVNDSTLFFVNTSSVIWSFESGPEGSTKDNVNEKRTYIVNGKPIKCLEKKFIIRSKLSDNPRSETVSSNEVDCVSAETVLKPYLLLVKYRGKPTSNCLD